jgi:CheY-like chemotaxis protein
MPASTRPHSSESRESKFRILYLGADLELITALRKALTEPDYRLVSCSDRESAIMFLKSEIPYDLLLIDFEWPGAEDLKLARLAHSLRHRKRMPIVLTSATPLDDHLKKLASKAGARIWVTKTQDMAALAEVIQAFACNGE